MIKEEDINWRRDKEKIEFLKKGGTYKGVKVTKMYYDEEPRYRIEIKTGHRLVSVINALEALYEVIGNVDLGQIFSDNTHAFVNRIIWDISEKGHGWDRAIIAPEPTVCKGEITNDN